VGRIYLVADADEIARRRRLAPAGRLVEAWPDLHAPGRFWVGATSKALLDGTGEPLASLLSLEGEVVSVYYGPGLAEIESLPAEESLQARVLSAHGIAVACITRDREGRRSLHEPAGPMDPVFFLRRPGGTAAHLWRLFRERREAEAGVADEFPEDDEAREWASTLTVADFEDLLARHAAPG